MTGDGAHTEHATVPLAELQNLQRHLNAFVKIDGVDGVVTPELRAELMPFAQMELPSAKRLAQAAMAGAIETEAVLSAWNRARKGLYAMAPRLVELVAAKAENSTAPGDTRVLLALLEGMGLTQQGLPVSAKQRESQLKRADLRAMPDADLDRLLLTEGKKE